MPADCGLARKTRHVRVRGAFYRERYRHLRPSRSDRSGPQRAWCLARASAQDVACDCGAFRRRSDVAEPALSEPKPQDTAERRQVTVMFSDLVGSTALSARMDPEDLREVISAYQKCVAETVQRFGGFVAKYMGDGVLIYFGYPQAHEDDAERAVRAGLELVAAVGAKRHQLQTRVGIATGLVVVGDLIGSGDSRERAIVGETPNLAARLQGIAEPNSVVMSEGTRRLSATSLNWRTKATGTQGHRGPMRAWAALRPSLGREPLRRAARGGAD